MLLPVVFFSLSWIVATVIARTTARGAIAHLGSNPYDIASQRALTPIEYVASVSFRRRMGQEATHHQTRPYRTYPFWLKIAGIAVDATFALSVCFLLLRLPWGNANMLVQLMCAYVAAGIVYFCYVVLAVGQIGPTGYHMTFLSIVTTWPRYWNKYGPSPKNS